MSLIDNMGGRFPVLKEKIGQNGKGGTIKYVVLLDHFAFVEPDFSPVVIAGSQIPDLVQLLKERFLSRGYTIVFFAPDEESGVDRVILSRPETPIAWLCTAIRKIKGINTCRDLTSLKNIILGANPVINHPLIAVSMN